MYSDRTKYYLETMGIQPWVRRNATKQLAVLVSRNITPLAKVLFQKMLDYLALPSEIILLIPVEEQSKNSPLQFSHPLKQILIFGQSLTKKLAESCSLPVVVTICPQILIQDPLQKKQVFLDLCRLKVALGV
jgi:hypothetical protein